MFISTPHPLREAGAQQELPPGLLAVRSIWRRARDLVGPECLWMDTEERQGSWDSLGFPSNPKGVTLPCRPTAALSGLHRTRDLSTTHIPHPTSAWWVAQDTNPPLMVTAGSPARLIPPPHVIITLSPSSKDLASTEACSDFS